MSEAAEPLTAVWGGWSLRVASDGAAEFVETDTGAVAARGALHPLGGSDAKLHSLRLEPVADGLPFDLAPPAWWPEFAAEWPVWIDREAGCVRVGEPSADPARACLWRIDGAEASAERRSRPTSSAAGAAAPTATPTSRRSWTRPRAPASRPKASLRIRRSRSSCGRTAASWSCTSRPGAVS